MQAGHGEGNREQSKSSAWYALMGSRTPNDGLGELKDVVNSEQDEEMLSRTKTRHRRRKRPRRAEQIFARRRGVAAESQNHQQSLKFDENDHDVQGKLTYPLPKSSYPKKKNAGRTTRKNESVPRYEE